MEPILRFKWLDQTYEFRCLRFGLNSAPRVFTKVLKSLDLTEGVQNHCESRRHDADDSVTPETDIPIADTPADTSVAGLQNKLGKVLPCANTGDTISRTDSELGDHETGSSPRRSESTDQKMSTSSYSKISQH